MATNSLHSIPHNHHSLLKRHHLPETPPPSLFLKPTTPTTHPSLSSTTVTFSLSANATTSNSNTTSPSPSSSAAASAAAAASFDVLQRHLAAGDFRQADEETRRLLIVLAGEAAQKRGYVFFSEVQFIAESDLRAIDELWRTHSQGRFGYGVQRRIFKKVNKDFTRLFMKLGWMKKLDTEVEQWNYRSFPTEFIWDLNDETPEGHLPLTNALRGTQLFNSILSHPAFQETEDEAEDDEEIDELGNAGIRGGLLKKGLREEGENAKTTTNRVFKPDYSF